MNRASVLRSFIDNRGGFWVRGLDPGTDTLPHQLFSLLHYHRSSASFAALAENRDDIVRELTFSTRTTMKQRRRLTTRVYTELCGSRAWAWTYVLCILLPGDEDWLSDKPRPYIFNVLSDATGTLDWNQVRWAVEAELEPNED